MRKTVLLLIFPTCLSFLGYSQKVQYAVIVSANMEWKALKKYYPDENYQKSVWGEYFYKMIKNHKILFFHEGWGKVAAAGATQYVIDQYSPDVLVNLGTCGGIEGEIKTFDVLLVNKTIIYDIKEAMGDSKEAIADYSTEIDLSWLKSPYPSKVLTGLMVSGDRDLVPEETPSLKEEYGAVAGDWETGAIAYVSSKNKTRLVILRGVSDVVTKKQGEAYGNLALFVQRAEKVMADLLEVLPEWIEYIHKHNG